MPISQPEPALITLESGVIVDTRSKLVIDWASCKSLVESGVPRKDVAELFKISTNLIDRRAATDNWLTPTKVEKLRKEIAARQQAMYVNTGRTMDVAQIKAEIWTERGERWKEQMAEIVDTALTHIPAETAQGLIQETKDLKAIQEIARTLTGEMKAEENAPKMAVNISFLRGGQGQPVPLTLEAEYAEED